MATYPTNPALAQGVNGTDVNPTNWNKFVDNINAIGADMVDARGDGQTFPGTPHTALQSADLDNIMQSIKHMIADISGETNWYDTVDIALSTVARGAITFGDDDATPSITSAGRPVGMCRTATAHATALDVTDLDDASEGQIIIVIGASNANKTTLKAKIVDAASKLNLRSDWEETTGECIVLMYDGTAAEWYEISRSPESGSGGGGDNNDLTKSDAAGGDQTVNLLSAVGRADEFHAVVRTDSTVANTVTVTPYGSETISGSSKYIMRQQYEAVGMLSDGVDWWRVCGTGTEVNVRDFGATGDGVTDDTDAILAAISACNTADILYFPRGNYYVSAELTIAKNLWVRGDGLYTQIYQSADANLFNFTAAGYFLIEDMRLGGEGSSADTCLIRAVANASFCRISNIMMRGSYYGIGLYGVLFATIQECSNTSMFYRAVSATNEAWIHTERSGSRSVNSLALIANSFQVGKRGIDLNDSANEGSCTIVGGTVEAMTVKGIYISGYKLGTTISSTHLEGAATNMLELSGCTCVSVTGCFSPAFTVTGCLGVDVRDCYIWGGITIDATSHNIDVVNCKYETPPSIAGHNIDVSGVYDVGNETEQAAGTFFPKFHISNLVDGDLEVWNDADQPLDFVGHPTAGTIVEESTIVRFGSRSAKVICDAGQTVAMIRHTLENARWDRAETNPLRYITISFWAYKPAADGFNPRIAIFYDYPNNVTYGATFTLDTETWTRCQQSFRLASAVGWTDPEVFIGNPSVTPGDYCYIDGVTITEGTYAPPSFDDGRGKEGNFRVTGNTLRGGSVSTMVGNETFTYNDGNVFIKDPGGAGRNFNPSGAFPEGTEITVINAADAAEAITVDSATLACPVRQDERAEFIYDGAAWQVKRVNNKAGDRQSFSFMQTDVADEQAAVALDVLGLAGNTEYTMPYPGSIVGISVASNDARTAGTLTVDATIDGAVTGLQAILNAANTTYHSATQARNADAFTANQRLGVKITTDAAWEPDATPDIVVVVIVEM